MTTVSRHPMWFVMLLDNVDFVHHLAALIVRGLLNKKVCSVFKCESAETVVVMMCCHPTLQI